MAEKDLARFSANLEADGRNVKVSNVIDPVVAQDAATKYYVDHHGGSNPPSDQNQSTFVVSPTSVEVQTGATVNATVTSGAKSGYTFVRASVEVRDQNNRVVTLSGNDTDASRDFTVDRGTVGTYNLTGAVTVSDTDDSEHTYHDTATVHVNLGWYWTRGANKPSDVASMENQGVWTGNTKFTAPAGSERFWVALPTRTGGYEVLDGFVRLIVPGDGETFDTDYTIYSSTEIVAGTEYELREV